MIYVLIPTTPDREKRLKKTIESVKKSVCTEPLEIVTDLNNYEGYVKSVLRMVNKIDGLVIVLNNDMIVEPDTIQILYDAYIKAFPYDDGLCGFGDTDFDLNVNCAPFAHTKVLREIINPVYFHNFVDREWTGIMQHRGKYLPVPNAVIHHEHYSKNPELLDETYKVNQDLSDADGKIYYERKERNFDLKPVIHVLIPTTPDRKERVKKTIEAIKKSICNQELSIIVDLNEYEGYVKSVLRMLSRVNGLCIVVTDDLIVWPSTIQALYNAYTKTFPNKDGLCVYGDEHWDLQHYGLPFAHSDTLKEIINPDYFHNFHDKEMCEVMKMRDRYLPVPEAKVSHYHYQWYKEIEKDKTYQVGEEASKKDGELYMLRRSKNFNRITAVLITRDKEYPKEIDTSWFDEVLIKTESPSVYERYLLAEKAKNDIIYVQDDDAICDYHKIWERYNGKLTNGITRPHQNKYMGTGVTLVGWGCFFPKRMIKELDRYIRKYGVDKHLLREADRIFTYLNQPHNSVNLNHHDFRPQKQGRMWNEADHWTSMEEAIQKVKSLT